MEEPRPQAKTCRRIGLFGGTFNPPHNGHIALAETFLVQAGVDEVWMMVSPQNPFKVHQQLLDDAERLEMVRLAVEGRPHIMASDYEFSLPRPSYTYHTLCQLRADFPSVELSLLIGGDNWASFNRWFRHDDVLRMASLYVYPRQGQRLDGTLPSGVHLLHAPLFNISSTEVRERVARGKDITSIVPPVVADYIARKGLYLKGRQGEMTDADQHAGDLRTRRNR